MARTLQSQRISISSAVRALVQGSIPFEKARIAAAAESIVETCLAKLKETEKLVLAIGENHDIYSHTLLNAKVLSELHKRGVPMTFALEDDENLATRIYEDDLRIDNAAQIAIANNLIKDLDRDGHLRAKAFLGTTGPQNHAPLQTALTHNIPVIYADAARQQRFEDIYPYVDFKAPKTRAIAESLGYMELLKGERLASLSFAAVHIRNAHMVAACASADGMKKPGPHVVLLQTGRSHIQGSAFYHEDTWRALTRQPAKPKAAYVHSLTALFREQGTPMLGVVLAAPSELKKGMAMKGREDTMYYVLPEDQTLTPAELEALDIPTGRETDLKNRALYVKDSVTRMLALAEVAEMMRHAPKP